MPDYAASALQCCHYCVQGHCVRHDQTELRQRDRAGLLNVSKRRAIRETLSLVIGSQLPMRVHPVNQTLIALAFSPRRMAEANGRVHGKSALRYTVLPCRQPRC